MKENELLKISNYEEVVVSLVLLMLYGVALGVVINGAKYKLIILLIAMMMLSEVGTISYFISRIRLEKW
jgi:hypothetical protein